jgi:hypothetical protein
MPARALAEDAMNADVTEVRALVIATAEAHTVLTLVWAPAAPTAPSVSRVDGVMAAEAAADNALNPE